MAYEENLKSRTLEADASIGIYTGPPGAPGSLSPNSGKQFRFVKLTGPDTCGLVGAAPTTAEGVLQNKPQRVGDAATVGYEGTSKVECGAAVPANSPVTSDATGRAIVATGSNGAVLGRSAIAGAGAGQLISVILRTPVG